MQNLKRCGKNPAHQALAKEVSSSIVLCISWTVALFGTEAMQGQEASSSPPLPISPAISATPLSFQTRGFQSFGYDSPGSVSYTGNVYDDFAQQLSQNIPYIPAQHGPTGDYNFKVGGLTGSLLSTLNFGYTDNIFLAEKKAESDFSIQPGFGLGLQLEVSRQSRLRLDIGLGYNFYVNHSELNYLSASILPNSVLDYRFVVGDVMIVVFDRFSAPNDARLRPEIGTGSSGLVNYQRINNRCK